MTTRSKNEDIKEASRHLRGTIAEGLALAATGAIAEDDAQLTKFHGTYLQDDRDLRPERRRKKLEQAYAFMVRVRVPGGVCTPAQWLAMDRIADDFGNGTLRLTTRQAFQLHGVIKSNLKRTMQAIHAALMDTVAACGDVNRNVMCNPNPHQSRAHAAALELARAISDHLTPRTGAYHEIWLDGEKVVDTEVEEEPIYGRHYLPRKFKTVVAVPPSNDVDVFAHDLGFVAITDEAGAVVGYNVTVGGGMGMTHGEPETYPRTADVMGFCRPEQAVAVAEQVVSVQRDFGDRANRKHARLKYTIEDRGLDWFRAEVERRLGYALEAARPFRFESTGDRDGWTQDHEGNWHYTLFIENGRVKDTAAQLMKTGLRTIAGVHQGDFRLTANQNLMIARVAKGQKARIDRLLRQFGLTNELSGLQAQLDGLRGAADLRPGAGRERALSAGPGVARSRSRRGGRSARRRDRDPHDGLPERLRAALSRRDRPGRARARHLQPLSRRRLRRLAAEQAVPAGRGPRRDRPGADALDLELRQGPVRGRAVRRLRDPGRPRRGDHGRQRLPRQPRAGDQSGLSAGRR